MHFCALRIARMASAFFSSGMPATSDGSRMPRSNCELTNSLWSERLRLSFSLGVLSLNDHYNQRIQALARTGFPEKISSALAETVSCWSVCPPEPRLA
jgi:hypothetical protein